MISNQASVKELIHNFVDGNLSESETDQLWAVLLGRPDDLDYLQTLVTLKKMGQEGKFDHLYDTEPKVVALHPEKEEKSSKDSLYEAFKPYLAAASVLIIGFAILFNLLTNVQEPQSVDPIAMIEYEIERSATNQNTLDRYLEESVSLATNGDLEAAFNQLNEASSLDLSTAQGVDLKMVKGAIQYNSGNFHAALATFQEIKDTEGIDHLNLEKGIWYLANTQFQLGMIEDAKENMREVIEMDGAFSRVAKQKLERF